MLESNQARVRMIPSPDRCRGDHHVATEDSPYVGGQSEQAGSNHGGLNLAVVRTHESIHKAGLDLRKVRAAAPRVRRCSRDGKRDRQGLTKSLERNSPVERRLHDPSDYRGVHAVEGGRGHSPDNLLRGPHFQLTSALDAEALWAERGEVHDPAWCAGGMTAAARSLGEALQ